MARVTGSRSRATPPSRNEDRSMKPEQLAGVCGLAEGAHCDQRFGVALGMRRRRTYATVVNHQNRMLIQQGHAHMDWQQSAFGTVYTLQRGTCVTSVSRRSDDRWIARVSSRASGSLTGTFDTREAAQAWCMAELERLQCGA